tara:strand:+ start:769 stop:1560 length:792 start_codon:yes stop_codon:yes gene_type:complete
MDNFNNIIKQKAEQFEVPFNDTHWAEMDAKLNGINSAKKKILFLGSAAAAITLIVSAFFLFPTNTSTDLNSNEQIPTQKTSKNTKETLDQPTLSKKETISNPAITEEKSSESIPNEAVAAKEKTVTTPLNKVVKETKNISPGVVAEKRKVLTPELKPQAKPAVLESDLKLKISEIAPIEQTIIESPTKNPVNTIQPQTTERKIPATVSAKRIKKIRHKVYEDENVSKKSIKRRRRSILSFISFKKRIYKVPLSRKKSSTKKKK